MILFTSFSSRAAVMSAALLGSSPVVAMTMVDDLTLISKITEKGIERTATDLLTWKRARLNHGTEDTIVDFAAGRAIRVSHKTKEYSEATFTELERALTEVSAEMEKSKAGVPEGLRSKMMGDSAMEVRVSQTDSRTIAGLPCDTFVISLGETTRIETCVTKELQAPFDPKYFKQLALVSAPPSHGNLGLNKVIQKLRELDGISLASVTSIKLMGRMVESKAEVTEIRRGTIEPGAFDVPADYKKVESSFTKTSR